MRRIFFIVFLFQTMTVVAEELPYDTVQVGIVQNVLSMHVSCAGGGYVYELAEGTQAGLPAGDDILVKLLDDGRIAFGDISYRSPVRIAAAGNDDLIRINGKRFHDTINIMAQNGHLTAVNELRLEDYLCGILPVEADPNWAPESLKVQAVASRTYVLRNMRRHEKDGFDVCDTMHCQVYGGVDCEDVRSNNAVAGTRNEVLMYQGQLAQTLFHASCGGCTENPNNVWSWDAEAPPYLRGRRDKYCRNSPHQDWKNLVKEDIMRKNLTKAGYVVGTIQSIKIEGTDSSGRAKKLKIKHKNGVLEMKAASFRLAVDPWIIRSTMFKKIVKKDAGFLFSGYGWGHGVGMCQWGAKVMAERGKDYKEILKYYYPGTTIEKREP
ncbi:MAG: SpoIID/LytB domain-containing protein [Elusimicrobiota bacterium]